MGKTLRVAKTSKFKSTRPTCLKSSKRSKEMKPSELIKGTQSSEQVKSTEKESLTTDIVNIKKVQATSRSRTNKADKIQKKTCRLKKISSTIVSKWQNVPQPLQNTILATLEDSLLPFAGSGDDQVQDTLNTILIRVQHTLQKIKVPKEKWMDTESLKSTKEILLAEKARLDDLEATLQEELRQLNQLQTKKQI